MYINHWNSLSDLSINNPYPLYQLTNRLFNKFLSLPSDIACKIHCTDWFEQSFLLPQYRQQLKQYKKQLPQLDFTEQAIVEKLKHEGVCVTSLDALDIPNSSVLLDSAQQITAELFQQSRSPSSSRKHTLMASANQLMAHPEIFLWGLSERILKMVEAYLGLPVAYDGPSFYYSMADGKEVGPRIWHRDKEDWRMIKVAVYLNDVDEFGGPFQTVKPTVNDWLIKALPKYKGLTHSELQQLLSQNFQDWLVSCIGKAGTVIFTDTSRFYHRGEPPMTQNRSAIFFHYFSQRPKNPFYCERSLLSRQQTATLAQQLSPHLQKHLTWRDHYPGIGRYIPKNYMRVDNW
jgi:hypothetical protein